VVLRCAGLVEDGEQRVGRSPGFDPGRVVQMAGAVDVDDQRRRLQLCGVVGGAQGAGLFPVKEGHRQPGPGGKRRYEESGDLVDDSDAAGVVGGCGLTEAGVVTDAVVVGGEKQLRSAGRGRTDSAMEIGTRHVDTADRRVGGQFSTSVEEAAVKGGLDGQHRQRAGVRSGEHGVLPAVGVDAAWEQQSGGAVGVTVGVEQTHARRDNKPPVDGVLGTGDAERTRPGRRQVGRGQVDGDVAAEGQGMDVAVVSPVDGRRAVDVGHGTHGERVSVRCRADGAELPAEPGAGGGIAGPYRRVGR
jgi:hypothetical protein